MKKAVLIIASIIGFIVLGTGGYAYYLYHNVKETASQMHDDIDRVSDKREKKIEPEKKDPISILMLGVDEREHDRGRSDTMIVITVNPNDNSMKMFNIPRDTRTQIIGKGFDDKINHAYAFGGIEMAMDTVENFLDIPIDYYIKVNMEAFKDIVSAVDGVTVNNEMAFNYEGYTFPEGELKLNANEALAYSRMRYEDPRGDLGRNERQRKIIEAIIDEGASFSSLTKVDNILEALGKNVKTNLTFEEMKDIQQNYKEARKHIETFEVKGSGKMINGIYYYMVSEDEKHKITAKLKEHLHIS
ncbi:LytR family transcriptional regulator [Pseudalkalibacillus caeni]|uniref:Polyisoprenyl-teichoic acid--peptidoglycan teichoic acid transferase TagU n=1 Tax=Exobacillus caeni TaxID=2574798 RepID=A0A5R9F5V2_9BACL|nr:LytR family transcriptional regulator [Pseudalkalibacillus caeni]